MEKACKMCGKLIARHGVNEELTNPDWYCSVECRIKSINNTEQPNMIEHPPHYKTGGIETIDYIKAKMTPEQWEGYLLGNVTKYLSRYQHKGKPLEDLKKGHYYLERLIECYDKFNLEEEKK